MKMKYFINLHKGATGLFVLLVMALFDQWHNPTAWLYLALHGTYGLLWVLKSRIFPDRTWGRPVSWLYGVGFVWGGLSLYWIAPLLLAWRDTHAPAWYLGMCATLYTLGVFIHFAADMQKHTALKLHPNRLISDGMFSRLRNPNYFGELLIYLGFGLLAMHWAPPAVLALAITAYWLPMMRRKDRSLSRYPEFERYRQRTNLFIPFVL
jgi:steroid 5-alpha reductase family enzyme